MVCYYFGAVRKNLYRLYYYEKERIIGMERSKN